MDGSLGPLFDTPKKRVLAALGTDVRLVFETHLQGAMAGSVHLAAEIEAYLQHVEGLAKKDPFIDVGRAREAAEVCKALAAAFADAMPAEDKRLIEAAIAYFLSDEDANSDLGSLIGFDDDLEVALAVAKELGVDLNR